MSGENKNQIDNPQTATAELPAAELEKITGGDKVASVQQTPTESVTLEYGKVEYKSTPQK